jgi:hypothetical protein
VPAEGKKVGTQMQADGADERGLAHSTSGHLIHRLLNFYLDAQNEFQKKSTADNTLHRLLASYGSLNPS